eukprot:CAMPEP_0114232900 /NCGR_PEP_ID=MMETSP0058-20121206/4863_1 /TAXON_ID=36894 /ORGANISM="Pyramimonas parkeae, CCMP726" /LENGTH=450 /DNA_ID=CAMNT_0001344425 /DNA_START=184 /DNA_END=1532 /DNA_ORIENTATION=+
MAEHPINQSNKRTELGKLWQSPEGLKYGTPLNGAFLKDVNDDADEIILPDMFLHCHPLDQTPRGMDLEMNPTPRNGYDEIVISACSSMGGPRSTLQDMRPPGSSLESMPERTGSASQHWSWLQRVQPMTSGMSSNPSPQELYEEFLSANIYDSTDCEDSADCGLQDSVSGPIRLKKMKEVFQLDVMSLETVPDMSDPQCTSQAPMEVQDRGGGHEQEGPSPGAQDLPKIGDRHHGCNGLTIPRNLCIFVTILVGLAICIPLVVLPLTETRSDEVRVPTHKFIGHTMPPSMPPPWWSPSYLAYPMPPKKPPPPSSPPSPPAPPSPGTVVVFAVQSTLTFPALDIVALYDAAFAATFRSDVLRQLLLVAGESAMGATITSISPGSVRVASEVRFLEDQPAAATFGALLADDPGLLFSGSDVVATYGTPSSSAVRTLALALVLPPPPPPPPPP